MTAGERLLVVEATFALATTGTAVLPEVHARHATFPSSRTFAAELRRPDGSRQRVTATLQWTHFDQGGYRLLCVLVAVGKDDVPVGTEIWVDAGSD